MDWTAKIIKQYPIKIKIKLRQMYIQD